MEQWIQNVAWHGSSIDAAVDPKQRILAMSILTAFEFGAINAFSSVFLFTGRMCAQSFYEKCNVLGRGTLQIETMYESMYGIDVNLLHFRYLSCSLIYQTIALWHWPPIEPKDFKGNTNCVLTCVYHNTVACHLQCSMSLAYIKNERVHWQHKYLPCCAQIWWRKKIGQQMDILLL